MGESKRYSKGYVKSSSERGSVNIAEEVVTVVAAVAAVDVEGVHGLFVSPGKELTNMVGEKGMSKGVKLNIDDKDVVIEVNIIVEMGVSISEVGAEVQRAVIAAVEAAVGIKVSEVNVRICGIALR